MFPSRSGFIGFLFEVSDPDAQESVITVDAFTEINSFYESMKTVEEMSQNDKGQINWDAICNKVGAPG